jgi:hypothetical protein
VVASITVLNCVFSVVNSGGAEVTSTLFRNLPDGHLKVNPRGLIHVQRNAGLHHRLESL